jgi:hypothetical protein
LQIALIRETTRSEIGPEQPEGSMRDLERYMERNRVWEWLGGDCRGHSRQKLLFLQTGGLSPWFRQAASKACRASQRAWLSPPNSQRLFVQSRRKGLRIT